MDVAVSSTGFYTLISDAENRLFQLPSLNPEF